MEKIDIEYIYSQIAQSYDKLRETAGYKDADNLNIEDVEKSLFSVINTLKPYIFK